MAVESCSIGFELLKSLITWGLVVGGWLVVGKQAETRERRKEQCAMVERVLADIESISTLGITYLTQDPADEQTRIAGDQIKFRLKQLGRDLYDLREALGDGYTVNAELIRLRRALTGGDFEGKTRIPVNTGDPAVTEAWAACADLSRALRRAMRGPKE